jgi:hypothetical protein
MNKNYTNPSSTISTILFTFVVVCLFFFILQWGNFLIDSGYIMKNSKNDENFDPLYINQPDYGNPKFSHTVDIPLTTTYTCQNMCSSQSKCYLTGGNCTSDIDCVGCNPFGKK